MLCASRLRLGARDPEKARVLAGEIGTSEVTAQLLLQRGLTQADQARAFLEEGAETAHDPFLMHDMARAVELLEEALAAGTPILVHGDYDVDGVCSTVLLYETLTDLGGQVLWHVPDRFSEGYGVSVRAVEEAADKGAGLLLTCDCGSSSHRAVERAHELGMKVIISDHHHLPERLPEPEAFLNPHLPQCTYPFSELCGTGVAFKIACALHQSRGQEEPWHQLDLVALATIADVVPLLGENRALVRSGLERLAVTPRLGLRALAQVAGVALEEGTGLKSFSVAFGLAPRLNAAGRLESARLAVELLLCQDGPQCLERARRLDALNQERRSVERNMRLEVVERLQAEPERLELGVVVEAGEHWHQGVVGITASRIVELYGMPAFIISLEGEQAKGSARSPENVDLREAMALCSDVFQKWGGHARAAGFSLEASRVDELRARLSAAVAQVRQGPAPVRADLALPLAQATLELTRELNLLEPIGEGNRRPVFLAERVRLDQLKTMGSDGDHLRMFAVQGSARRKAVAFRQADDLSQLYPERLYYDILFQLEEDTWDGTSASSLLIEALLEPAPALVAWLRGQELPEGPETQFLDLRHVLDRRGYLRQTLERSSSGLVVVTHQAQIEPTGRELEGQLGWPVPVETLESLTLEEEWEDIILLSPPLDLEMLRHPLLWTARRVHCLFGDRELAREEHRQRALWLDRGRMETIWKGLARRARGGRVASGDLAQVEANGVVLQEALGVLEELGVARWEEGDLKLGSGGGRRLEDSARFREAARRRQRFSNVWRMFQQRELRLAEHLRGA